MSEFVVKPLKLINVHHDHSHTCAEPAGTFDFLGDTQLKVAAVEDSCEAIEIRQLLYALYISRILDRSCAYVGSGFERLGVIVVECVALFAVHQDNAERL